MLNDNEQNNLPFLFQGVRNPFSGFSDAISLYGKVFGSLIKAVSDMAQHARYVLNAADICKNNQWIIYHKLPVETLLALNDNPNNCNTIMLEYYSGNNYKIFKDMYSKYKDHSFLTRHKFTLEQAFDAFVEGKYYNLSVYSLLAVFDGVLAVVTNNETNRFNERFKNLKSISIDEFMDAYVSLSEDGISLGAFLYTFDAINSIVRDKDTYLKFGIDSDPKELNRDFILHGRSDKTFTETDCLKIFNFIFALLYYSDAIGKEACGSVNSFALNVPLTAEAKSGRTWYDAK